MYPGVTNPYARWALAALDILVGVAMGMVASFCIFYWGRAFYRSIRGQSTIKSFGFVDSKIA